MQALFFLNWCDVLLSLLESLFVLRGFLRQGGERQALLPGHIAFKWHRVVIGGMSMYCT